MILFYTELTEHNVQLSNADLAELPAERKNMPIER